jgi:hypothetical protein
MAMSKEPDVASIDSPKIHDFPWRNAPRDIASKIPQTNALRRGERGAEPKAPSLFKGMEQQG